MPDHVQMFYHVRILLGVVLALAITRILSGLPRFFEHRSIKIVSVTHLFWIGTVLLMAIHFWWFQFGLIRVQTWHFSLFVFVLFYAFLFILMANMLVPDELREHRNYNDYFMSRRRWFFGLLAVTIPVDLVDTLLKGTAYYRSLGIEYPLRLICLLVLCAIAAWTQNRRFHVIFAGAYFVYLASWIVRLYEVLE
ncbi:MAG: hypothetical protein ACR2JJ_10470 [Sphingomicrobium sp.]